MHHVKVVFSTLQHAKAMAARQRPQTQQCTACYKHTGKPYQQKHSNTRQTLVGSQLQHTLQEGSGVEHACATEQEPGPRRPAFATLALRGTLTLLYWDAVQETPCAGVTAKQAKCSGT